MTLNNKNRQAVTLDCRTCPARRVGFCASLEPTSLDALSRRVQKFLYARGSEIVSQGNGDDGIGLIASGLAKATTITERGDEYTLQILRRGQLAGNPDIRDETITWQAATDATICRISTSGWQDFLRLDPSHFQSYLVAVEAQFHEMQNWMILMRGRTTTQRVAVWLLSQVPAAASGATCPSINIQLTRRDLASLLDMTVETLCRALHTLQEKGAIDLVTPEQIEVSDLARLRLLAKCPDARVQTALARPDPALSGSREASSYKGAVYNRPRRAADWPCSEKRATYTDNQPRYHD